jgi:hypothetical protein
MASPAAINWIKGLLDSNPDSNTIVAAHSYLNKAGGYGIQLGNMDDRAWCANIKSILDTYPNVFLTLSGHDPTGFAYSKASGNREEIFFNRQSSPTTTPHQQLWAQRQSEFTLLTWRLCRLILQPTQYSLSPG